MSSLSFPFLSIVSTRLSKLINLSISTSLLYLQYIHY